jgi:hypothetical protein
LRSDTCIKIQVIGLYSQESEWLKSKSTYQISGISTQDFNILSSYQISNIITTAQLSVLSSNNITDFSANPPTTNFSILQNNAVINYIELIISSDNTPITTGLYMLLCYSSIKQSNNTTNLSTLVFMLDYYLNKSYLINSTATTIWLTINEQSSHIFKIINQMNYHLYGIKFYLYRYL